MKEPKGYLVNPSYVTKRSGNYEKAKPIQDKWTPTVRSVTKEPFIGNVRPNFSLERKRFEFTDDIFPKDSIGMYQVFSSALLLYRLLCLFKAQVVSEGPEGYKCVWWITLQHKETGDCLMFGEWKGAAGIWTVYHSHEELKDSFKQDILELLDLLAANDCPHPYDGTVAGSVA